MRAAQLVVLFLVVACAACGEVSTTPDGGGDDDVDADVTTPDAAMVDAPPDAPPPRCGDGVRSPPGEECDDGNTMDDGNGCGATCLRNSVCGNSRVESYFEVCDGTAGCSGDCKQATLALTPVSDRGGGDFDGNGTYDAMNQETSTGEAVAWVMPEERRIAWEFATPFLTPTAVFTSAQFTLFPNNISGGPQTMQMHGYRANGAVELVDMTANGLIASPVASSTAPMVVDARTFLQGLTTMQPTHVGFMLRLETRPAQLFNLGISMSNNMTASVRPRLDIVVCADPEGDGC